MGSRCCFRVGIRRGGDRLLGGRYGRGRKKDGLACLLAWVVRACVRAYVRAGLLAFWSCACVRVFVRIFGDFLSTFFFVFGSFFLAGESRSRMCLVCIVSFERSGKGVERLSFPLFSFDLILQAFARQKLYMGTGALCVSLSVSWKFYKVGWHYGFEQGLLPRLVGWSGLVLCCRERGIEGAR
jgi:hypothetical protein